jgi:hypothetical protein
MNNTITRRDFLNGVALSMAASAVKWEEGQAPHELGRKPMGRISIANSDSEAAAYVQAAIDAAVRAVGEVSA